MAFKSLLHHRRLAAKEMPALSMAPINKKSGAQQFSIRLNDELMARLDWKVGDRIDLMYDESDRTALILRHPQGNKLVGTTKAKIAAGGHSSSFCMFTRQEFFPQLPERIIFSEGEDWVLDEILNNKGLTSKVLLIKLPDRCFAPKKLAISDKQMARLRGKLGDDPVESKSFS